MSDTIYLAMYDGLVICQREQGMWQVAERVLSGQHVTSMIAREGVILAGTSKGVQRSDDGGKNWRAVNTGLSHLHVRWMAYHPEISDLEFAGTEPAGIFVSRDGAEHWEARPEVAALRDQHSWMLPYSPEAGCVRGFSFLGQRAYAAVEVGGVLRSDDGGQHWALAAGSDGNPDLSGPPAPFIYPDIHDIAIHPSNPDVVFAATGGGFYGSQDGGATWTLLYDCYVRALWLDLNDPKHIICGPADGVGTMGRIEVTHDGGKSWQPASGSLEVPWRHNMAERITQIGDELFVVLDDGSLLAAPLATLDWQFVLDELEDVNAVTAMG